MPCKESTRQARTSGNIPRMSGWRLGNHPVDLGRTAPSTEHRACSPSATMPGRRCATGGGEPLEQLLAAAMAVIHLVMLILILGVAETNKWPSSGRTVERVKRLRDDQHGPILSFTSASK